MEVIGDPKVFAVQLNWDRRESTYKPWMYGVFCVFVCGERLGSPQNQVTLKRLDQWFAQLPEAPSSS